MTSKDAISAVSEDGTSAPAQLGERIGGYRLEKILGQGGMGCVYLATHTILGRKAAIKVLADRMTTNEHMVSRFCDEAKIVNDIRHPNIVDITDFVITESPRRIAYVMEYIEGVSLAEVIRRQRLTIKEAMNICFQLVNVLEAIHAADVVHRDLKPNNILVLAAADGVINDASQIKVLDFGIAKGPQAQATHKTRPGLIMGTPAYMAPEQISEDAVSAATDIYAFGEILYELVSAKRAFPGKNIEVLRAKLSQGTHSLPLPIHLAAADDIGRLVSACLLESPEARPTLEVIRQGLTRILEVEFMITRAEATFAPAARGAAPEPALVAPQLDFATFHDFRGPLVAEDNGDRGKAMGSVEGLHAGDALLELSDPVPSSKRLRSGVSFLGLALLTAAAAAGLSFWGLTVFERRNVVVLSTTPARRVATESSAVVRRPPRSVLFRTTQKARPSSAKTSSGKTHPPAERPHAPIKEDELRPW